MKDIYELTDIEHQEKSLPFIHNLLYNITGDEKIFQIELNRDIDTLFIIPRLMKKKDFGPADLEAFVLALSERQREIEELLGSEDFLGGAELGIQ